MSSLKFIIGSGEATPGGVLAPVLAPYGLDLQQIAKEINGKTLPLYQKGVPLPVKLYLSEGVAGGRKSFKVEVAPPTLSFLYSNFKPETVVELYTLFLLYTCLHSLSPQKAVNSFFGSLSTVFPTPNFKL
jgi:hypothetical protein